MVKEDCTEKMQLNEDGTKIRGVKGENHVDEQRNSFSGRNNTKYSMSECQVCLKNVREPGCWYRVAKEETIRRQAQR